MTVFEFVDQCLLAAGVERVFGVPGALVMPIWQNLSPEVVLCGHEQEASYVAVGYAKMSRSPVAVVTTGGPGVLNAISGLAAANIDSVPVIYISGRTPIAKNGLGVRQEESQFNRMIESSELLARVTKYATCIDNKECAAEKILRAFRAATSPRCGCVHLSIPIDVQSQDIGNPTVEFVCARPIGELWHVPRMLRRPLLAIGWGCWVSGAVEAVYRLAERIGAPVLVTSKAYCCANPESDCYLGKLGYAYNDEITRFIREYKPDQLVAIGTSLGEKDYPAEFWNAIEGAEVLVIGLDTSHISQRHAKARFVETDRIAATLNRITCCSVRNERACDAGMILRARLAAQYFWKKKVLPEDSMAKVCMGLSTLGDAVVTADAGNHLLDVAALHSPRRVGGLFIDVGLRAMGTGICFCIGMAEALPTLRYVAVTGDGCMLMNGNAIHLAAVRKLPITFLVLNNHSLGRVRVGQSLSGNYRSTDVDGISFKRYGESLGLKAYCFDDIEEALKELPAIVDSPDPAIVELVVPKDEIPVTIKNDIY